MSPQIHTSFKIQRLSHTPRTPERLSSAEMRGWKSTAAWGLRSKATDAAQAELRRSEDGDLLLPPAKDAQVSPS